MYVIAPMKKNIQKYSTISAIVRIDRRCSQIEVHMSVVEECKLMK